jgi:hypothetical protein
VSHKTSRQPLDRETVVSRPGASDPVVYSVGVAERSSIVSDYRTIQMLQQSWADSANEFKALLKSFIISTRAQPGKLRGCYAPSPLLGATLRYLN